MSGYTVAGADKYFLVAEAAQSPLTSKHLRPLTSKHLQTTENMQGFRTREDDLEEQLQAAQDRILELEERLEELRDFYKAPF